MTSEPSTTRVESPSDRDLSPRLSLALLASIFAGSATLRIVLNSLTVSPLIFLDELRSIEFGRSISFDGGLRLGGVEVTFASWGYPLIIAPFLRAFPIDDALEWIRRLNAVMVSATVPLTYLLAREVGGRRAALASAGLIALLPGFGYAGLLMAENAFLPVFTLALWLAFRAIHQPTIRNRLTAGLAFGLAFHVKPEGLFLPAIYALTVLIFELLRRDETPSARRRWIAYAGRVARHGLTALGWLIALAPRVWISAYIEKASDPLSLESFLGAYDGVAAGLRGVEVGAFCLVFLAGVSAWILATGFFPAAALAAELRKARNRNRDHRVTLMAVMTTVATLFVLAMASRHTLVHHADGGIFEGYFMVVIPPVIALFCAGAERGGASSPRSRSAFSIATAVILLAMVTLWIAARLRGWSVSTDSPSLAGLLLILNRDLLPSRVLILAPMLAGLAGGTYLAIRGDFMARRAAVAVFFVCFNFAWYAAHHSVLKRASNTDLRTAEEISEVLPPGHRLLVLTDGLKLRTVWHASFRNPGTIVHFSEPASPWYSKRLRIGEEGSVHSFHEPERTWLLAGSVWEFNKPPVKRFPHGALYRVGGRVPLAFDPAQVEGIVASAGRGVSVLGGELDPSALELSYLSRDFPSHWRAGETTAIKLVVRNDSLDSLNPARGRFALGYHWSDPERTGSWEAVVWDDGNYVSLPQGLGPLRSVELEFDIIAPDRPGRRWSLTISPLHAEGTVRTWSLNTSNQFVEWVRVGR